MIRFLHIARIATVIGLSALAAGCGLPGAGGSQPTGSNHPLGDGRVSNVKAEHYAFARARVPITLEGTVASKPRNRAGGPAYALTLTVRVGEPKYTVDKSVPARMARAPEDRFIGSFDEHRLLRSVVATGPMPASPATTAGYADFPDILQEGRASSGPRKVVLRGWSKTKLDGFRLDKEIDPIAKGEVEQLVGELADRGRGWGLLLNFTAEAAEVTVGGRKLKLAPGGQQACREPVCFRLPIPYRLTIAGTTPDWRGKLDMQFWLPNGGPIGAIDVLHPAFGASGAKVTFENGMLRSLAAADQATVDKILRLPSDGNTAVANQR